MMKTIGYYKTLSVLLMMTLILGLSSCGIYLEDDLYYEEEIIEFQPDGYLQLYFTVSWNAHQTFFQNDIEFDLVTPNYQRISRHSDTSRCRYDAFHSLWAYDDNAMVIACEPALFGDYDIEIRSNTDDSVNVYVNIDQSWDYQMPYSLEYANLVVRPYETLVYPIHIH